MPNTLSFQSLKPIIKWAEGKEKELKHIIPNAPDFRRIIEPFVGGGSVFTAFNASKSLINDKSEELTALYKAIASNDADFFRLAKEIDSSWRRVEQFLDRHIEIVETYLRYRFENLEKEWLKQAVDIYCETNEGEINLIISKDFGDANNGLAQEMRTNIMRKLYRMREIEKQKHELPYDDIVGNILTAMKSALYMCYRTLYNAGGGKHCDSAMHCALFLFIRNYAYSGMFRYNEDGKFNVQYGGMGYNKKTMDGKLRYYQSDEVRDLFRRTSINSGDFEDFLRSVSPTKEDFVFLDPPYDSEFSTYAGNAFTREDQARLASYMINECEAKWMLIIKHTDFIYNLYDHQGINIRAFDKEYLVSFMNRNNKKATHLLITNYRLPTETN